MKEYLLFRFISSGRFSSLLSTLLLVYFIMSSVISSVKKHDQNLLYVFFGLIAGLGPGLAVSTLMLSFLLELLILSICISWHRFCSSSFLLEYLEHIMYNGFHLTHYTSSSKANKQPNSSSKL